MARYMAKEVVDMLLDWDGVWIMEQK